MEYETFSALVDRDIRGALHLEPLEGTPLGDDVIAGRIENRVLRYRAAFGRRAYDLVRSTDLTICISPRFIGVLRAARLTGWNTVSVSIENEDHFGLGGYAAVTISGRCQIDPSLSRWEIKPPPVPEGEARRTRMGVYFSPDSWDGSDLFIGQGSTLIIVTDRARKAIESSGITNVAFEALADIEVFP